MRRTLPKTLFGQLVLGTIVAQTLLLGLFIWYTVVSQKQIAEVRTRQRIGQQLDRLASACAKQWAKGDMASLHDVLELSRIAPTIEVARLTDLSGKTMAVSESGRDQGLDAYELDVLKDATHQQIFSIRNGQLEAVTPVAMGGKTVALLWLEPNHAVSLNTLNAVVRVSLTYGGFALLANLLPIFLIVRSVTKPLRRLKRATQQVMQQNPGLPAGFPLPVTTRNEAGDLTASFNTMVRELEEQRRGLLETLALLDSMLGNAPIGFAFFDPGLNYVRLNQFLADMYEVPIGQQLGRRVSELFPGAMAEELEACLAKVFATGQAMRNVELSGEMRHAPNVRRSWLMHFYPVRTEQETIRWVGVIVVEITERLQAEETLRRTEKLAATGRLAASIAHEINNPLEAVTNLLYLLRTHSAIDETALSYVSMAQAELGRVSEITQQMLRFYRQSTLPRMTDVGQVLESVLDLYQSRIVAAHVTVAKKFSGSPGVFGLSGEMRQVFANLIGNALDAMPGGGQLVLRARRGSGRRSDGVWSEGVRVSVTDNGSGMSRETMARVFEAFFTTKQATGTGLGLWVSEEIIRKHSGSVRVRSRTGMPSGTCFSVFFPDAGLKVDQLEVADATVSAG
ncbi:sensor histidine kinase [Granulicella sibirica]|nr:ATP-binding protein [Granulicella sibirica]